MSRTEDIFASNLLDDEQDENDWEDDPPSYGVSPPSRQPSSRPSNPPPQNLQRAPEPRVNVTAGRLVIGIDYGTTYTGVAYARVDGDVTKLEDITIVKHWGADMTNQIKVPSVYSYSLPTGTKLQWGSSLSQDCVTYVNTKMELGVGETQGDELELIQQVLDSVGDMDFDTVKKERELSGYTWKSPEGIVTDYLKKIFTNLYRAIQEAGDHLIGSLSVDLVITVPVGWSYRAKNSTLRALRAAGFNETTFPNLKQVILVSEPEAAALYTARHLKEDLNTDFLQLHDCFVLCDAGGGTVDCVSYQVKRLRPLELERISMPTSGKCGSAYVDADFKRWLKAVLGDNYRLLDPRGRRKRINPFAAESKEMREVMGKFRSHKHAFSGKDKNDVKFFFPQPDGGLYGITKAGVLKDGELTISHEIMKRIFERCVNNVVDLIDHQLEQVDRGKGYIMKNVFMVGGFSESQYLQDEIKKSLRLRDVTLRKPSTENAWTAVVQGAVMYGIEKFKQPGVKSVTFCKESFGAALIPIGLSNYQSSQSYQRNSKFSDIAQGQVKWIVRKGDILMNDEPKVESHEVNFYVAFVSTLKFDIPILRYNRDDENPSERYHIAKNLTTPITKLTCNISNISFDEFDKIDNTEMGVSYFQIPLTLKASVTANSMTFEALYSGMLLDSQQVKMDVDLEDEEDDI